MDSVSRVSYHCVKYRNFTKFHSVKILWKDTVSAEFWVNRSKLYGNRAFSQNLHTRKLSEISVFYIVHMKIDVHFSINLEMTVRL